MPATSNPFLKKKIGHFQQRNNCVVMAKTKQIPLSLSTTIHVDATVQKNIPKFTKPEARPTWIFSFIPVKRGYM